jgi:predicted ATP-grasp superfamily ATP-dependent carboligase
LAKILIIAAPSARGYVQAAVACGYAVIAVDAFIDEETRAITKQTFKLKLNDLALDEVYFKRLFLEIISSINLAEVEGLLYGSLFDDCPDVLDWVAKLVPVIGNSAETMKLAKDFSFFALLDSLNIAHPKVQINFPDNPERWFSKKIGGCGGVHIQPADLETASDFNSTYYQEKLAGRPVSMLFVADGNAAHLIGFNLQLTAPTTVLQYRFAGAISNVALQPTACKKFEQAAQRLTKALALRGICSLDAIVVKDRTGDEDVRILELNPRLSATFSLYENLLPLHLHGCAGHSPNISIETNSSHAQLILYADEALAIPEHFVWPSWASDIPTVESDLSGVKISQHMPICSVLASAESVELAHALLLQRAGKLTKMLKN